MKPLKEKENNSKNDPCYLDGFGRYSRDEVLGVDLMSRKGCLLHGLFFMKTKTRQNVFLIISFPEDRIGTGMTYGSSADFLPFLLAVLLLDVAGQTLQQQAVHLVRRIQGGCGL